MVATSLDLARPAPALCVSIHDVAPHTWSLCARLMQAIEAVAPIPLTLLVVPHYHRRPVPMPGPYQCQLEARLARGDELALHGFTHLDEAAVGGTWRERFWREIFTLREGEFAALGVDEARRRIASGLSWFAQRGWPVSGFVAPAWLLGAGARQALIDFPFRYTTTLGRFHFLPQRQTVAAPAMFYCARTPAGRWLSQHWNTMHAMRQGRHSTIPLLRFGLHPQDANFPEVLRNCQRVIERLLLYRTPMTKATFATQWLPSSQTMTWNV